jgi:PhnB protein
MRGFAIATGYASLAETKAAFDALCQGGTVVMPWAKTFWSEGFGMVSDRFGTHWMLGVEAAIA